MVKAINRERSKEIFRTRFNPKLRRMLLVLCFIAFGMFAYVVFSSFKNDANPVYVILGLLAGVVVGVIFSRMFKISWNENSGQIVYRMDIIGLLLLILFIIFDFSRSDLVSDVISGSSVKPTSIALLAGTFYGRLYGMRHSITQVLREQKVLPPKKESDAVSK